jgi:tetratricopeptide (TPR) repeat protein
MGLKIQLDRVTRTKVPGSSIIYIPSGKYLKIASLGYSNVLADMVYLWAIQYYGDTSISDRFDYLDHIFSIIAELDPLYLDPYEIGAIIAVAEAGDFDAAFKILDRGLEKNPDQWIFPFEAGHYASIYKKDYKLAQEYYKRTMQIEGAPAITKRLYANAAFMLTDYESALKDWVEVYKEAEKAKDERVKKIAANHIYRTRAAMDIEALQEAVRKFKEKFEHFPEDLSRLVSTGYLRFIPEDPDGREYAYDNQTGEVKTAVKWWKR